jgi:hypothetical protein
MAEPWQHQGQGQDHPSGDQDLEWRRDLQGVVLPA